jgi:ssRNA-specific RNase YbeY (16S rRNA maturation enzyme)
MTGGRVVVEVSSTVRSLPLKTQRVRELVDATLAAEKIRDAMISVTFVGRTAITRLNRKYPSRLGIPISQELARLVVHGTLHVAGHDHPEDDSRALSEMWKKQERILAARD